METNEFKKLILAVADKYKFRPAIIEKDYYITKILNNVNKILSDQIVFKGGTLLNKIYLHYARMSEDLDFVYCSADDFNTRKKRSKLMEPIKSGMKPFLELINLKQKKEAEGFNESQHYIFYISYYSFISEKEENIQLEISLRNNPVTEPVKLKVKHIYRDLFTNKKIIPENKILSLSYKEAVAEKLRAAITRKNKAIRDYYDLWNIEKDNFNFNDKDFLKIFKTKLKQVNYEENFSSNLGITNKEIELLRNQIQHELLPVIREREEFDLELVLNRFNHIFEQIDLDK